VTSPASLCVKCCKPHWCEIRTTVFSWTPAQFPFHNGSVKNLTFGQSPIITVIGKAYLRQRGIEPIRSRMDRRTTIKVGAPDFMFAFHGHPIAIEVKMPGEKLSPDQERMKAVMTDPWNGWRWFTVFGIDDLRAILRSRGL